MRTLCGRAAAVQALVVHLPIWCQAARAQINFESTNLLQLGTILSILSVDLSLSLSLSLSLCLSVCLCVCVCVCVCVRERESSHMGHTLYLVRLQPPKPIQKGRGVLCKVFLWSTSPSGVKPQGPKLVMISSSLFLRSDTLQLRCTVNLQVLRSATFSPNCI
jgi:hypothetical protein